MTCQSVLGPDAEDPEIIHAILSCCSCQSPITYVSTPPPSSSVTMEDLAQQLNTVTGTLTRAMRMIGRPSATSSTVVTPGNFSGTGTQNPPSSDGSGGAGANSGVQ